jgi:hypothetical protein
VACSYTLGQRHSLRGLRDIQRLGLTESGKFQQVEALGFCSKCDRKLEGFDKGKNDVIIF